MDAFELDHRAPHLMSVPVNLLLLLSALLSALTGVGAGVRPAQAAVAVSRVADTAVSASRIAASPSTQPVFALPDRADVASITGPVWRLAPAAPLYLSRRRE